MNLKVLLTKILLKVPQNNRAIVHISLVCNIFNSFKIKLSFFQQQQQKIFQINVDVFFVGAHIWSRGGERS